MSGCCEVGERCVGVGWSGRMYGRGNDRKQEGMRKCQIEMA